MTYVVSHSRVDAEVSAFDREPRQWWTECLAILAEDPHPRFATWTTERPVAGTWTFDIVEEVSISGETVFVLTAEFFVHDSLVYAIKEQSREVEVVFLRPNRRA